MRTQWRNEADDWSAAGAAITSSENLAAIRSALEHSGPVIVEWWHYRGSSAPDRFVFGEFDEFVTWLGATFAGDLISVWDWATVCRDDNAIAHGKSPDDSGKVPSHGAY